MLVIIADLAHIVDRKLSTDVRLGAHLKTMKYVQRPELPQRLVTILDPKLDDEVDVEPILRYINSGPVPVSREVIQAALRERLGRRRQEQIMGHFTKEFEAIGLARGLARGHAKGLAKGRTEGRAKGRAEGEAKVLIRLLEKRFGEVSAKLRERIFASDIATIEAWFDRALEARNLKSIFRSAERG